MPTTVEYTVGNSPTDDYTLAGFETATDNDLVSADEVIWGLVNGQIQESIGRLFLGATTDATRYRGLKFKNRRYDRASGLGDGITSDHSNYTIYIEEDNFRVEGLLIENTDNTAGPYAARVDDAVSNATFDGCTIVRSAGSYTGHAGGVLRIDGANVDRGHTVRNCLLLGYYPNASQGINFLLYPNDTKVHNVVSYNADLSLGFFGASTSSYATLEIHNCISFTASGTHTAFDNDFPDARCSNNISGDDSATGHTNGYGNEDPEDLFENYSGEDFHIQVGSQAHGTGADKSGSFTDDIEGYDRTTTTSGWSIGCYIHPLTITEHTVGNDAGDDYTPAGWEAATDVDCRAIHTRYVGKVNGQVSVSSVVSLSGDTSDENRYRKLTYANAPYDPIAGSGDGLTSSLDRALSITDSYVRVEGLLLDSTVESTGYTCVVAGTSIEVLLDRCTIKRSGGVTNGGGALNVSSLAVRPTIQNCTLIGDSSNTARFAVIAYGPDMVVRNCTINGFAYGLSGSGSVTYTTISLKNVIATNCSTACYSGGGVPAALSYCIADDATAAGTGSHDNIPAADLFRDAANNDFRLLPTAVARGAGVAIEDNTHDFSGLGWNETPSIGAYELTRGQAALGGINRLMMR